MEEQINEGFELETISKGLSTIRRYLEIEMARKQLFIEKLESDADTLRKTISEKDTEITSLQGKLQEMLQSSEGNRQIINKLLNDISHYQKDLDWYKRTYEKRSFLGVIKEKILKKPH
jgi:predicted  nucleic acid-binding Zn-ribbon protein